MKEKFREELNTVIAQKQLQLKVQQKHGVNESLTKCVAAFEKIYSQAAPTEDLSALQTAFEAEIDGLFHLGWQHPHGITGKAAECSKAAFQRMLSKKVFESKSEVDAVQSQSMARRHPHEDPELTAVFSKTKELIGNDKGYISSNGSRVVIKRPPDSTPYRSGKDGELVRLGEGLEPRAPQNRTARPSATAAVVSNPTVQVLDIDSLNAARVLIDQGCKKPLVLNMANRLAIGGGVEFGAPAQEEDLFRRSNYAATLYPLGENKNGRHWYKHSIGEFGCIYSPSITVFREGPQKKHEYLDQPFEIACLAVAGYDLGKKLDEELADTKLLEAIKAGTPTLQAFETWTQEKIKLILEMALHKGHDSLVLGALSCGAFRYRDPFTRKQEEDGRTAERVANAFKTVLEMDAYKGKFKHITFAVLKLGAVGEKNFAVFDAMVKTLPAPYQVLPASGVKQINTQSARAEVKEAKEGKEKKEEAEYPKVKSSPVSLASSPDIQDLEKQIKELQESMISTSPMLISQNIEEQQLAQGLIASAGEELRRLHAIQALLQQTLPKPELPVVLSPAAVVMSQTPLSAPVVGVAAPQPKRRPPPPPPLPAQSPPPVPLLGMNAAVQPLAKKAPPPPPPPPPPPR